MPLCAECKKRPAVVFITDSSHPDRNIGYCFTCARKLGVPNIENMIKQFGISPEMIENMENQMADAAQNGDFPFANMLEGFNIDDLSSGYFDEDYDDEDDDDDEALDEASPEVLTDGSDKTSDESNEIKAELVEGPDENDNSKSKEPPRMNPFARMFGGSFEMGGAQYADDAPKKKRGKNKGEKQYKYLNDFCENLTKKAREGRIDAVIGRDKEISRVIQILSRKTKNNPCLIGEPGVGKTAIAEGLALRIAAGSVPLRLADKEIHRLDLTALVAGTQFRGQFESRMKGLIDDIKAAGNVILFIDEVHSIVGAGDAEGSMNAANILKPALSRGEIQVIGATTFNEYRKHIEKDSALERRFQPVNVNEPSVDETVEVLLGIKEYYEKHHRVQISDYLVRRAVILSERYINDRFLPDKAIDLLDEACACASLGNKAMAEFDELTIKLKQVTDESEKLQADTNNTSEEHYAKIAELRTDELQIRNRLAEIEPEAMGGQVTESDLAKVIELWTGIQASRVEENEFKKLTSLEAKLNEKVIGQEEATKLVASAIRRSRAQVSPRRRPASFIFVGPTGVGKTELVKVLAKELFDSPETLIRLDMSEYMEKHSVSKIIGSPPGYVGYDEAGQLTEKVRRKPYSVLLFDEIEKAHPDVMNILLQILDEGKINDSQGRAVSFENTVIIMTSNAGSDRQGGSLGFGKTSDDISKEKAIAGLREFLRPEFLARVDEIVVFRQLDEEDYKKISRLLLGEYVDSMAERNVKLVIEDSAVNLLAKNSMGGAASARDLRNLIRREVEDKLANLVIETSGDLPKEIVVSTEKIDGTDTITVKSATPEIAE
ncbi:MAG: ATP-dependent Clp protease ATP-binding subunit [Acutalibacteraceae bacterium]